MGADPAGLRIERLGGGDQPEVRRMLVELALDEQRRYDHPRRSRAEIERTTSMPRPGFAGENRLLAARDDAGELIGVCWCVLFDPGTGLEGEVAELYVAPRARRRGVATRLLTAARELFEERGVTFACVWTRDDNAGAMAAYRAAGFHPTEQTVLTWLPLGRGAPGDPARANDR